MRIILWDIDGTLVSTGGAGMRALGTYVDSSAPVRAALARMRLDGMTDRRIARHLCAVRRHHDAPDRPLVDHEAEVTADELEAMIEGYLALLPDHLAQSPDYRVLPGVREALDDLEGLALHALGTGNHETGARLKLEHGGLWHRFSFGGFGSDAEERPAILQAAWKKAESRLGRAVAAEELVVVGDTPRDISAAHAVGLACVALATGRHSLHELAQAGADLVLVSLEEPEACRRLLATQRPG